MANPAPGYAQKPAHRVDLLPESAAGGASPLVGAVIADSKAALRVEETGHGPVHYLPEKDVRLDLMRPDRPQDLLPVQGRLLVLDRRG